MTTRSPDPGETDSIFASGMVAEQWRRGKVQRDEVTGRASEMMLDLANLRAGNKVLDVAAGTGEYALMAARRVGPAVTCRPRTFPAACWTSPLKRRKRRVSPILKRGSPKNR